MTRLRCALVLACLVLVFTAPLQAAGTVTFTSTDEGGGVRLYAFAWTSTAGGAVSGNAKGLMGGRLLQVLIVPNTAGTQPTDLYDITLVDENSIDLLNGRAANLSNATGLYLQFDPALVHDTDQDLDLVVANAGNAKTGTLYVWVSTSG